MQKTLIKLLLLQILLLVFCAGGMEWFAGKQAGVASLAGGIMAIVPTLFAMLVFRRLPTVIPGQVFYRAMIVCEVAKWFLVVILGMFFLQHHPPLWLLLGFMATYGAYFWILLIDRG